MWTFYVLSVNYIGFTSKIEMFIRNPYPNHLNWIWFFFSFFYPIIEAILVHSFDPYFRSRNNSYKRLIDIQLSLIIYIWIIYTNSIAHKEQFRFSKWDLMWTLLDPLSSFEKTFLLSARFSINFSLYLPPPITAHYIKKTKSQNSKPNKVESSMFLSS